MIKLDGMALC